MGRAAAQVRTFLLERSRVTSTSKARERSYHVLYELCAGKTPWTGGLPPEAFNYLSLSGTTTIDGHDDAEEYNILAKSLLSVGIAPEGCTQMTRAEQRMLYIHLCDPSSTEYSTTSVSVIPNDLVHI